MLFIVFRNSLSISPVLQGLLSLDQAFFLGLAVTEGKLLLVVTFFFFGAPMTDVVGEVEHADELATWANSKVGAGDCLVIEPT